MKKLFKSKMFFFILGVLVIVTSTVFAYNYVAQEIGFTSNDSNWKNPNNTDIENVSQVLNNLYSRVKDDDYVIPYWVTSSAGNSVCYGFLQLPDLTPYRILRIGKIRESSGKIETLGLQSPESQILINFSLSENEQVYDISGYTGTGYGILSYGSGMQNWGAINFFDIVLQK